MKRLPIQTITLVLAILFFSTHAAADDLPRLVPDGEHMCKVSKEYKFRKCRVVRQGDAQILSLYEPGHLLQLEGEIHPNDFIGKKAQVYFEAKIKDDKPYICDAADQLAQQECKNQTVMVLLKKKGNAWVGTFPVKHYWKT